MTVAIYRLCVDVDMENWFACVRGFSGWLSGAWMIGRNKPVAGIMFVIGALFSLLAAVCFILLIRVRPDSNRTVTETSSYFLRATACNAKRVFASVRPSVRLSVCHTAVLCQNDAT